MLWRFWPLFAGFWDGVSGMLIWPSVGFSIPTITNDELEILCPTLFWHKWAILPRKVAW